MLVQWQPVLTSPCLDHQRTRLSMTCFCLSELDSAGTECCAGIWYMHFSIRWVERGLKVVYGLKILERDNGLKCFSRDFRAWYTRQLDPGA